MARRWASSGGAPAERRQRRTNPSPRLPGAGGGPGRLSTRAARCGAAPEHARAKGKQQECATQHSTLRTVRQGYLAQLSPLSGPRRTAQPQRRRRALRHARRLGLRLRQVPRLARQPACGAEDLAYAGDDSRAAALGGVRLLRRRRRRGRGGAGRGRQPLDGGDDAQRLDGASLWVGRREGGPGDAAARRIWARFGAWRAWLPAIAVRSRSSCGSVAAAGSYDTTPTDGFSVSTNLGGGPGTPPCAKSSRLWWGQRRGWRQERGCSGAGDRLRGVGGRTE